MELIKLELIPLGIIQPEKPLVFRFGKRTLIASQKNSVGKTTLLRFLMSSFGFDVPQTKGVDSRFWKTSLVCKTSKGELEITRNKNWVEVYSGDQKIGLYDVKKSEELESLLTLVFEIQDARLLKNLFGCFYIDQEQGWQILNKGRYYKTIPFSCKDMVEDPSEEAERLAKRIDFLKREKAKYDALLNLIKVSVDPNDVAAYSQDGMAQASVRERNRKRVDLLRQIKACENEIGALESILTENSKFAEFIEKYQIRVVHNGQSFTLVKEEIENYSDNQLVLSASIANAKSKLASLRLELKSLEASEKDISLFDDVKTISDETTAYLREAKIDSLKLNLIIKDIQSEISKLNAARSALQTRAGDRADLEQAIINRLKELGVFKKLQNVSLLTGIVSRRLSGVELANVSLGYKLGCIDFIEKKTKTQLPLIIDSPATGERVRENLESMMQYLNDSEVDRQIVVSSTQRISTMPFDKTYELTGMVLQGRFQEKLDN